jgi:hypothetical protein
VPVELKVVVRAVAPGRTGLSTPTIPPLELAMVRPHSIAD